MEFWMVLAVIGVLGLGGLVAKFLLSSSSKNVSPATQTPSRSSTPAPPPPSSAPMTSSTSYNVSTDVPKGKDAQNGDLWDRAMLNEITNDDDAMELEMIETFIESTADEWRKFETALAANVSKDAEIYAHSIKGAAKYTGAKKVADVAYELEKICKAGDLEGARRKKAELKSSIDETCAVLQEFLDKNK